jgi:penicillin-binding protein 2
MHQMARLHRARGLSIIPIAGALILTGRLFALQVVNQELYSLQSEKNHIRREWVTAQRGLIVDREGKIVADSRPSFSVVAIPREVMASAQSTHLLSEILKTDEEQIRTRLSTGSRHLPRVLWRDVDFAQVSQIIEREEDLRGVSIEVSNVRWYPNGTEAGHLLGHVGEISEEELVTMKERGFKAGDFLGRTGIEKTYDHALRGTDGERFLEVDAVGRIIGTYRGRDPVPAIPGSTLRLHLDLHLQALAESCLVGRRGAVCMMDVSNGGMMVFASAPAFDPGLFATGITTEDWRRLNKDPEKPLLNRCVQATYAPGSTFKMLSMALALEKNIVGQHGRMRVSCAGGYRFGNRYFRCWEELGHGPLDLEGALIFSCDTFFYQVGERVQVNDFADIAKEVGLGSRTGIDLPQESSGNVPTVAWLDKRFGKNGWGRGALLNYSIGQGEYLATPMQMVRFAACIAAGGNLYVPRIVHAIQDHEGKLNASPPIVEHVWDISPEHLAGVREAMRRVVADGTARGVRIEGFMAAGKTGTAENPHGEPHSWFMGYAPAQDPKVAFSVIVEAGGHGSDVAVPITKRLLMAYCGADTIPPPPPVAKPAPKQAPQDSTAVPQVTS